MSAYRALPADGRQVAWTPIDAGSDHHESVSMRWDNEAWTVTGTMPGSAIEFVSRVSPLWHTRQFLLFRDMTEPDLWLGTDGRGRWGEMNGAHRPDLDGATDIAIADSIIGLALPIQRLDVKVGERAHALVTLVDVETLAVSPEVIAYDRLGTHRWRITAPGSSGEPAQRSVVGRSPAAFDVTNADVLEFDVDDHGLPIDIDNRFRRLSTE